MLDKLWVFDDILITVQLGPHLCSGLVIKNGVHVSSIPSDGPQYYTTFDMVPLLRDILEENQGWVTKLWVIWGSCVNTSLRSTMVNNERI